jgi:hypothetical protein
MDKGKFARAGFITHGTISSSTGEIPVGVRNLALNGALVVEKESSGLVSAGDVDFHIPLAGADIGIRAKARVVHKKGSEIGLKFVLVDAESMMHLRNLLELNSADAAGIDKGLKFLKGE